jgi:hypothetical protein
MFGMNKTTIAKIIHMNFSIETVSEKNMTALKEFCHLTIDQDGYIQHIVLPAQGIIFSYSEEYKEPMISFTSNQFSGATKNAEIFIPKEGTFNLL